MTWSWKEHGVRGPLLRTVLEFKYFGFLFTTEGRMEREIERRISAVAIVMRSLYQSIVAKKEVSKKAKISNYGSINVPTLTYGQEIWVIVEKNKKPDIK